MTYANLYIELAIWLNQRSSFVHQTGNCNCMNILFLFFSFLKWLHCGLGFFLLVPISYHLYLSLFLSNAWWSVANQVKNPFQNIHSLKWADKVIVHSFILCVACANWTFICVLVVAMKFKSTFPNWNWLSKKKNILNKKEKSREKYEEITKDHDWVVIFVSFICYLQCIHN